MRILRRVVSAVVAIAAIGLLGFLIYMTQSVDPELHQLRLARLQEINNLDLQLSRTMVEARYSSIALAGNDRVKIADQLGTLLEKIGRLPDPSLDAGAAPPAAAPESLRGLAPAVNEALDRFLDTIEDKVVLAFDFEARYTTANQRMVNSLDAVPTQADALFLAANAKVGGSEQLHDLIAQLKGEVMSLAVTPTPANEPQIRDLLAALGKLAEAQPQPFKDALQTLGNTIEEVVGDKKELIERLNGFLGRPTGAQLQALELAYGAYHDAQLAVVNQYRLWLSAYAAVLLLSLALLGLRLVRSYRELDRANDELSHANEHLEEQVQVRTKDLSKALTDLRASQAQLVQSEKMASLGTMVAGVAHEINTPLGYVRSNTEIVRASLGEIRKLCVAQTRALALLTGDGASDEQVAEALGQATALAESLNPDELGMDLDNLLGDSGHGLMQISELVGGLKDFSRVDRSRNDVFNVNEGIDSALKICHNQLKHRVEVVKSYGKLPKIECAPSQLNQVFLNLFTNAAQAIDGTGKIYVHTSSDDKEVAIRILDTGCGMSEEVRARIFEPFFTTKPVGKGTGLGLSIVYRIVTDHGGRIDVRSTPGKGSEFIVHLPLRQAHAAAEPGAEPVPQLAAA